MNIKNKKTTIKDVAREAGVSTALVSMVINARVRKDGSLDCPVSAKTAERIQYVVKKLNYKPNMVAASLRKGRRHTIGVICPDMGRQYFAEISKHIESIAYESGYTVLFGSSDDKEEKLGNLINTFISDGVEGILITPCLGSSTHIQKATDMGIPVVLMTRDIAGLEHVGKVLLDNVKGVHIAMEHLVSRGFRRIEMVSNSWGLSNLTERENTYRECMDTLGLSNFTKVTRIDDTRIDEAMEEILADATERGAEAIIYPGASLGRVGLLAMKRMGRRIPEDLAILSFDGGYEYTVLTPSITQIQQSRPDTAKEAFKMLIEMSQGENPRTVMLEPVFTEGESTACVYRNRSSMMAETDIMKKSDSVLLPAVMFDNRGGWTADNQFMDSVGSTYLLAHGLGTPVRDASTNFKIPSYGTYNVFVRTMNWTACWDDRLNFGAFEMKIDDKLIPISFGTRNREWGWQDAGKHKLDKGTHSIRIHDLHGLDARIDCILLTQTDCIPPEDADTIRHLRTSLLEIPAEKQDGEYDFVVAGGGIAGICAAVSAARNGLKVALVHGRNILGGDNSSEVRKGLTGRINYGKFPSLGYILNEIGPAAGGDAMDGEKYDDRKKMQVVAGEKNITLFCRHLVTEVGVSEDKIDYVTITDTDTYAKTRLYGKLFADCTCNGDIGIRAGADLCHSSSSEYSQGNREFLRDKAMFEILSDKQRGSEWCGYILEDKNGVRFAGEYVLSEDCGTDIPDGCVAASSDIMIPYRCLYSRNIINLFMAGSNISTNRTMQDLTSRMRTGGMMGEVVGMAAGVCIREGIPPKNIFPDRWDMLEIAMNKGAGRTDIPYTQTYGLD